MFMEFFHVKHRSLFAIHNPVWIWLSLRLGLIFSHLKEHKFPYISKMLPAPCVILAMKVKQQQTNSRPFFRENRQKPLNTLFKIDASLKNLNDEMLLDIFLLCSDKHKDTVSKEIVLHTTNFLKTRRRLEGQLFMTNDANLLPASNFSSSFTYFL